MNGMNILFTQWFETETMCNVGRLEHMFDLCLDENLDVCDFEIVLYFTRDSNIINMAVMCTKPRSSKISI